MKKQHMVMAMDLAGLPRAWATGLTEADAKAECQRQLEAYCADPVREFVDPRSYTFKSVELDDHGP